MFVYAPHFAVELHVHTCRPIVMYCGRVEDSEEALHCAMWH